MKQVKVLVVQNEEEGPKIAGDLRLQPQCEVVGVVYSGKEAIREIEMKHPDVIVMDLLLPEADGFEVIEATHGIGKILVYTALNHENFVNKAFRLGAEYYVVKPTDAQTLWDRIQELAAKPKTQSATYRNVTPARKSLDERLSNVFVAVGIPANLKGYQFLREGIKLTVEHPTMINSITKQLYPAIAERFETTASKVERAIRHAIEVAWNRGRIESINSWYGVKVYSQYEKPTNGEFIALIADKMMLECR